MRNLNPRKTKTPQKKHSLRVLFCKQQIQCFFEIYLSSYEQDLDRDSMLFSRASGYF
jgi:hypothetical protein